jgi:hypothetical protein
MVSSIDAELGSKAILQVVSAGAIEVDAIDLSKMSLLISSELEAYLEPSSPESPAPKVAVAIDHTSRVVP